VSTPPSELRTPRDASGERPSNLQQAAVADPHDPVHRLYELRDRPTGARAELRRIATRAVGGVLR